MITYNTAIVLAGTMLLGAACGVVGTFAVLRRRALVGDAMAHASLPGLCAAFLLFEKRDLHLLLAGGLGSALLGIAVVALLRGYTRIKEDAAIGIVLSVFFGAGIVLSRVIQNSPMVASKAGIDSFLLGKTAGMILADVILIAIVSVAAVSTVALLYKELKLVSFDTGFAIAQGWPTVLLDLVVLGLVATVVMIGLPAVGVVLVAALLIIPACAARFWTDRLSSMLFLSAAFGALIGMTGTLLSARFSHFPAGPVIVLTGSVLLVISMLLAPRRGMIARVWAHRRFERELRERNFLVRLHEDPARLSHHQSELRMHPPSSLLRKGLVAIDSSNRPQLTEPGRERARQIDRGRKLWRVFLENYADEAGPLADLGQESIHEVLPPDRCRDLEALLDQCDGQGEGAAP